jgi:Ca-activated chloride channel family protein
MPFRFALLPMLALPVFATDSIPPGSLTTPKGICPLRHTEVQVRIAGPLARVTVTQEFNNPFAEKIEAVYTFPLPPDSAVDDMTMHVGDRTIRGLIKPRDEARKIYDDARRTGRIASLLDQERPNIFTQAVANILPGATVKIEIAYVETVPYEAGAYSFNFRWWWRRAICRDTACPTQGASRRRSHPKAHAPATIFPSRSTWMPASLWRAWNRALTRS